MPNRTDTSHPSGDPRFKMLDMTIRRHGADRHALIEVLHSAQEIFGSLGEDILHYVSNALHLPPSKVYGVATFYNFFSLKPKGRHNCMVCLGTACYVKKAPDILAALEKEFRVPAEQTAADGSLSLGVSRCFGSCSLAPVVILDGVVFGRTTAADVVKAVGGKIAADQPALAEN